MNTNQNQSYFDYCATNPVQYLPLTIVETTEQKFQMIHEQLHRPLPHDYQKSMMMYAINSIHEVTSF